MIKKIMVCVTEQITCELLIHEGALLAEDENDELFIVHVAKKNAMFLGGQSDSEALNFLYTAAREQDGSMNILRSEDIEGVMADFIKEHHITHVIMGSAGRNSYNKYHHYLLERFPKVNFTIIDTKERGKTYEGNRYSYRQG